MYIACQDQPHNTNMFNPYMNDIIFAGREDFINTTCAIYFAMPITREIPLDYFLKELHAFINMEYFITPSCINDENV